MSGRDARVGTEMVYLIALQKQPPCRTKGLDDQEAMESLSRVVHLKLKRR
jgi:hypothetical protein